MKASKYQWQRVWARKYSPFIASIFMMVYFKPEIFFSICKNKLFVPEGKLYAYYFEANEFKALVKKFSQKLLKTDLNTFRKKFEKSFIGYLESARRLNKINYTTLNNQQLIKVLKRIYQETGESNKWQMSAFVATEGLAKEVGEKVGNLPNGQKILQSIATPLRETLIKKARKELLRLALAKRNNTKELKRYAKKYAWLPMYEFCDSPWLLADFEKQLKQIENPAQEIKEIDQERGKSLPLYQKYFSSIKNRSWKKKIEAMAKGLKTKVREAKKMGKKVAGVGASTKGNIILQMAGLGADDIFAIGEVNSDKLGKQTPGTCIPIIAENELFAARPDMLIVFPWHFHSFFQQRIHALGYTGEVVYPILSKQTDADLSWQEIHGI